MSTRACDVRVTWGRRAGEWFVAMHYRQRAVATAVATVSAAARVGSDLNQKVIFLHLKQI